MANKKDFIASGPTKPDITKSHFDWSFTNNFTASFGKIYPLGSWLLPAGSHFRCNCDYGFDLQPLVFPVQTNMRFHVKFYKAPLRILWKNWRNFVSRGGKGYDMPYISRDTMFYETGSLSDYMGVPSFKTATREFLKSIHLSRPSQISPYFLSSGLAYEWSLNWNSIVQNIDSIYYLQLAPIDLFEFLRIKNGLTIPISKTSSQSSPSINSSVHLVICHKTSLQDGVQFFKSDAIIPLNGVASLSPSGSGSYSTLTIPQSVFENLSLINPSNPLYIGLVYNQGTNFISSANTSQQSAFDIQTVQNTYKVPASSIVSRSNIDYGPLSIQFNVDVTTPESNATHFMSVDGAAPKIPLLAFRWRMYEFIYNYFIRNERVTPFMLPDSDDVMQQVFNQYLTNDGDGADSTTPVDFKFAPYEYDLFTTCVKQPTFGDAPLVGVSFNYDMSGDTPTGEFHLLKDGDVSPETYQVSLDVNGRLTGITAYSDGAPSPNLHNLQELINFGISINDLRNVSAYQRYLERMVKAGTKYENIMYEFFGTNPPIGEEFPSYLGGYTDLIRTDKVLNQSASNDDVPLGTYGGNAYLRSGNPQERRQIRAYAQEDCYIMAIGWFSCTPTYSQKLDKDFCYTSLLDFLNPQFASVSPQPVYDYQIAPLEIDPNDDEKLHHVFGYNRPFAEYVSRQDECHGNFRSDMSRFIMQRIFGGVPKLNEQFLYMKPEDMTDIFAVTEVTDKIFGQIHFDVNATIPLPHMALPKIV